MFVSNPPKDLLRRDVDAPIIKKKFENNYENVTYFGMPGPEMLDVKEWLDYLGFVIAVDNDLSALGVMNMTAASLKILDRVQFLRGDVESILVNWQDEDDEAPLRDSFDVVNLDFVGGIMGFGEDADHDKRVNAIRELLRHQRNETTSFIMFLTIGFREKHMDEYDRKLRHIGHELDKLGLDATPTIEWYFSHPPRHKLKVYVPYIVDEIGRANRFRLDMYKCFYYKGTNDIPMMHFVFDMEYSVENVSPERLGLRALLDCPLFIAHQDHVKACPNHPPPILGASP
jgi:hypothetical protein